MLDEIIQRHAYNNITLSYHIISYLMFFYFISPFYSILFYFTSNWFDLILFSFILLNSIYYIVQYSISYQWMICVYLSVRPSVCLSVCLCVCLSVWISLCFLFSPVSSFFLFSFFSLSFLMNVFLTHTHGHGHTHTYIWIYVPSYDSYILLQKMVSDESYLSDNIISYLI